MCAPVCVRAPVRLCASAPVRLCVCVPVRVGTHKCVCVFNVYVNGYVDVEVFLDTADVQAYDLHG